MAYEDLLIDPELEFRNWREFRILFLDTETTGLDSESDIFRIVQYAGMMYENGKPIHSETLNILINPGLPIPEETSKIHNIFDEDVEDAPTFKEVAPKILEQIVSADLLCAYNHRFDRNALNAELLRNGFGQIIMPFLDPLPYDREERGFGKSKLEQLGKYYGCTTMGKITHGTGISLHNALSDVMLLAEVVYAMAPKLPFSLKDLIQDQEMFTDRHDAYYAAKYPKK